MDYQLTEPNFKTNNIEEQSNRNPDLQIENMDLDVGINEQSNDLDLQNELQLDKKGVEKAKGISIAQFFEANKQMLGFSSPTRNLLITIKEAVDNALDAAEDHNILLDLDIKIEQTDRQIYKITISDNGPGIPKAKIGPVFGRLLYGSKFHEKQQKRGQQGLGISACLLNSQIDLNKHVKVISKVKDKDYADFQNIKIDILKNKPIISNYKKLKVDYPHGVCIEIFVKGKYMAEGVRSIPHYLEQVSFMNPWAHITFESPDKKVRVFPRISDQIKIPEIAKIYPMTVALGVFARLITSSPFNVYEFLEKEIEGINEVIIKDIFNKFKIPSEMYANALVKYEIQQIHSALKNYVYPVNQNTIALLGEHQLLKGLNSEKYEFAVTTTSEVAVFTNTIAKLELALVYGGGLLKDNKIEVCRFVNKVPLLLQPGSCLLNNTIAKLNWKKYGLDQTKGELPIGPLKLVVHLAGYQIPFNSEAKESVAEIPGLEKVYLKTLKKLGLNLYRQLSKQQFIIAQKEKLKLIQLHIPELYKTLQTLNYPVKGNMVVLFSKMMNGLIWQKNENEYRFANYTSMKYTIQFVNGETVILDSNSSLIINNDTKFSTQGYVYEITGFEWDINLEKSYSSIISEVPFMELNMIEKLNLITKDISTQILAGCIPHISIRVRNKENLELSEEGYWVLGTKYSIRSGKKTVGLVQIIRLLKIICLFLDQLNKNNTSSLREIYYVSETWGKYYKFNEQAESDGFIEILEVLTGLSRELLGVFPEARGQIAGPIVMSQKTKRGLKNVDCIYDLPDKGGGILIPFSTEQMQIIENKGDFTLVIETSGTFNRLVEDGFHTRYNCNLICTNGQPTRSTREVIKLLRNKPILAFFDCDNWSYRIFGTCAYGSIKTAHLSHRLCIPEIVHLGLTYDDILEYNLPTDKLKKVDIEGFKQLMLDLRYAPGVWSDVLTRQLEAKIKAEQQSLAILGLLFVTRVYLPKKLKELGIIPHNDSRDIPI